jgi:hypothetical protein
MMLKFLGDKINRLTAIVLLLLEIFSIFAPLILTKEVAAEPTNDTVSVQALPSGGLNPYNRTVPTYGILAEVSPFVRYNVTKFLGMNQTTLDQIIKILEKNSDMIVQLFFQALLVFLSPIEPPPTLSGVKLPTGIEPLPTPANPPTVQPPPVITIPPEYRPVKPSDEKKINEAFEKGDHLVTTTLPPEALITEFRRAGALSAEDLTAGEHVFGGYKYIIRGTDSETLAKDAAAKSGVKFNSTEHWSVDLFELTRKVLQAKYEKERGTLIDVSDKEVVKTLKQYADEIIKEWSNSGLKDPLERALRERGFKCKSLECVVNEMVIKESTRIFDGLIDEYVSAREEISKTVTFTEAPRAVEVKSMVDLAINLDRAIGEIIKDKIYYRLLDIIAKEDLDIDVVLESSGKIFKVPKGNGGVVWVFNTGYQKYLDKKYLDRALKNKVLLEDILRIVDIDFSVTLEKAVDEIIGKPLKQQPLSRFVLGADVSSVPLILLDMPRLACFALNISGSLFVFEFTGEKVETQQPSVQGELIFVLPDNQVVRCLYVGDAFYCMYTNGTLVDPSKVVVNLLMDRPLYIDVYPLAPLNKTTTLYMFDEHDWGRAKSYVANNSIVFVWVDEAKVAESDIEGIVDSLNVVFVLMVDTQPYWMRSVPAFYPVFYSRTYLSWCSYDDGNVLDPSFKKYLGESFPTLIDYEVPLGWKATGTVTWGGLSSTCGWGYKKYRRGAIIEVPYDGFWESPEVMGRFIDAVTHVLLNVSQPARIVYLAGYQSGIESFHEVYPLDVAWVKLARGRGWQVVDLKSTPTVVPPENVIEQPGSGTPGGPGEPGQIVVYSGNSTVVDVGKKWKGKS